MSSSRQGNTVRPVGAKEKARPAWRAGQTLEAYSERPKEKQGNERNGAPETGAAAAKRRWRDGKDSLRWLSCRMINKICSTERLRGGKILEEGASQAHAASRWAPESLEYGNNYSFDSDSQIDWGQESFLITVPRGLRTVICWVTFQEAGGAPNEDAQWLLTALIHFLRWLPFGTSESSRPACATLVISWHTYTNY